VFGKGHWIQFDLGEEKTFNAVWIQWHVGNLRKANFTILISSNGLDFTEIWGIVSTGTTKYFEEYLINDYDARYVRLEVNGNNLNDWNSIADIEIRNVNVPNTIWGASKITASGWQEPNIPWNTEDWDPETRWSANGKGQWIQYNYLSPVAIREVEILWYQPTKPRQTTFTIQTKVDKNSPWKLVFKGQSSGVRDFETYLFQEAIPIQHMRITGYGNTLNDWMSISDLHAWTYEEPWE
jgi:hypothetical protein